MDDNTRIIFLNKIINKEKTLSEVAAAAKIHKVKITFFIKLNIIRNFNGLKIFSFMMQVLQNGQKQ
jgi:hypothetical protein